VVIAITAMQVAEIAHRFSKNLKRLLLKTHKLIPLALKITSETMVSSSEYRLLPNIF
jgi:hypothetical protein